VRCLVYFAKRNANLELTFELDEALVSPLKVYPYTFFVKSVFLYIYTDLLVQTLRVKDFREVSILASRVSALHQKSLLFSAEQASVVQEF
jgi:hypothetical protein